jgi:hypothetical protein
MFQHQIHCRAGRTYSTLRIRFLAWVNLHLKEYASVTTVWTIGYTFVDGAVNQSKVGSTIVKDGQRGCRGCSSCHGFDKLVGTDQPFSRHCLPLLPSNHLDFLAIWVHVLTRFLCVLLPRKVNLRIRTDGLTVSIHPRTANVTRIVVVYQWSVMMVIGRYVLKNCMLYDGCQYLDPQVDIQ